VNHTVGGGDSTPQAVQILKITPMDLGTSGGKRLGGGIGARARPSTWCPAVSSSRTIALPIKSVAPVKKTRIPFSLCCSYISGCDNPHAPVMRPILLTGSPSSHPALDTSRMTLVR